MKYFVELLNSGRLDPILWIMSIALLLTPFLYARFA